MEQVKKGREGKVKERERERVKERKRGWSERDCVELSSEKENLCEWNIK